MVAADIISWAFLAKIFMVLVIIKAFVLIVLGVWIFSRREVAKVVV